MVGALLAVGAGNLEPNVIAHKLAIGRREVPGEKRDMTTTCFTVCP